MNADWRVTYGAKTQDLLCEHPYLRQEISAAISSWFVEQCDSGLAISKNVIFQELHQERTYLEVQTDSPWIGTLNDSLSLPFDLANKESIRLRIRHPSVAKVLELDRWLTPTKAENHVIFTKTLSLRSFLRSDGPLNDTPNELNLAPKNLPPISGATHAEPELPCFSLTVQIKKPELPQEWPYFVRMIAGEETCKEQKISQRDAMVVLAAVYDAAEFDDPFVPMSAYKLNNVLERVSAKGLVPGEIEYRELVNRPFVWLWIIREIRNCETLTPQGKTLLKKCIYLVKQSLVGEQGEQQANGGAVRTPQTSKNLGGRPRKDQPTVNERMEAKLESTPEAQTWNASQWAASLNCSETTIKGTDTWKNLKSTREAYNAMLKVQREMNAPRH
ncbi:MAG: hypothetical protein SFX18_14350 [Pirellulales bacterium]|nr:hypothetical protein [Pirellulales bacterium]